MIRRVVIVLLAVVMSVVLIEGRASGAPSVRPDLPKECVGSDFATFGKIYDAVFDSFTPYLPPQIRNNSAAIKARTHRDMDRLRISNMLVSNHPKQLGAKPDDPIMTYRDPISLYVVSQLLNVRNGKQYQAITVENLTLAQAVETVWLFIHVTVLIPLSVALSAVPTIAPPFFGPVGIRFLITMPFYIAIYGARYLYRRISAALVDSCLVSMTQGEKDRAGKPIKDLRFAGSVPGWVADIAGQVDLADKQCPAIGDASLSRIIKRTTDYLVRTNSDPATRALITTLSADVERRAKSTWVPVNLIPADPADYNDVESLISLLGGYLSPDLPVGDFAIGTGGAPLDILIGLVHNFHSGADFGKNVRLWDLSVTKSMTAAYYTMYFTIYVMQTVYSNALPFLVTPAVSMLLPRPFGLLYAPLNFGFTAYHNVLRSMCFAEDRTIRTAVIG